MAAVGATATCRRVELHSGEERPASRQSPYVDPKACRGGKLRPQSKRTSYLPPRFTTLPLSATPAMRPPAPHTYSDSLLVTMFL